MSCTRSQEIDLLGFLEEPRRPEFEAFRDHYPRCPACAAEVAAWHELIRRLVADAEASPHPGPEALVRYDAQAPDLEASERARIERHLTRCDPCRDELRALRGFDPVAARAVARRPDRAAPGRGGDRAAPGHRGRSTWLETARRVIWHPAFAYGVAALLLLPLLHRELPGPTGGAEGRATSTPQPRRELASAEARDQAAEAPASVGVADASRPERLRADQAFPEVAERRAPPQPRYAGKLAASEPSTPAQAAGETVELTTSRRAPQVSAAQPLRLRVPVPPGAGGEVEIRLVAPGGRRELRERQPVAKDAEWLELDVPAGWLVPGRNAVEVRTLGAKSKGHPIGYTLRVE